MSLIKIKESIDTLKATMSLFSSFKPDDNCPKWLQEEKEYVSSLQHEPEMEHAKITYLEAIEHLECTE